MSHLVVVVRGTVYHGVGGMERHTEDLCLALKRLGHQVSVVTTELSGLPKEHRGIRFFAVKGSHPNRYTGAWWRGLVPTLVHVEKVAGSIDGLISQSTAAQSAVGWLLDHHIHFAYILHGSARDIMRENWGVTSTKAVLRYVLAAYYWRWNLKVLPKVPLIFVIGQDLAMRMDRDLLKSGAGVRLRVLPNAVDTDLFSPGSRLQARQALGLPADPFLLGYSGRLTRAKGVDWIRRWLKSQTEQEAKVHWAIAGAGPLASALSGEQIHNLGSLNKERLSLFYRALDVLLLPTHHREGVPLSVLEAMASGIPVVAFDTGGLHEIMDSESGILIQPGDYEGFADGILKLYHDASLRADLSFRARARIEARASWQQVAQMVVQGLDKERGG